MEENKLKLSEDQAKALELMREWLNRPVNTPDDCFYSLSGSAGTGKTTLVKEFVCGLSYPYTKCCVSAPTHKARKVVQEKSGCPNSETVQALLGLKPDVQLEEFDVAKPIFNPIGTKNLYNYKLVIIDECSMVNKDLYSVLKEDAIRNKTKILFIGDLKQLPPIKEELSMTLLDPIHKYNLTQIVRQAGGNPLIILLDMIREDIENGTDNYLKYIANNPEQLNEKGEGYVLCDNSRFGQGIKDVFSSEQYATDKNYARYIAWTNKSIKEVNNYIREKVFNYTEQIVENELLLSYNTIRDSDNDLVQVNSEDYIVSNIKKITDESGIEVYACKIKPLDYGGSYGVNRKIVVNNPHNMSKFASEHENYLNNAIMKRGKEWVKYYTWRNSYALLDNLMNGRKVVTKKDLDYGYGITIHKSQGSTFHTVLVNGKNINENINDVERRKLFYVALSRASTKAYIYL